MANRTILLTEPLNDYLLSISLREHEQMRKLREETAALPSHVMQMAPEQGQFLALLAKLIGAKRAIEVGVFTGYSALAVALVLPEDGRLLACDISDEWTSIGRRYWRAAGVADKIDLRLAPAQETLGPLAADRMQHNSFDFAFIDANKNDYDAYYELCLQLVRPGGLIAIDNVLWDGSVIDPDRQDEDTVAIRSLNEKLCNDSRVDLSVVPIGDGMTIARKR